MSTETQKVDLLAVLERMSHSSNVLRAVNGEQDEAKTAEEFAAVDAVAAMIAALRALDDASWLDEDVCDEDELIEAKAEARAALARVGGAA